MSRKDNLKKYGNMLHNAATKSSSKETVEDVDIVEEVTVITVTKSSNEEVVEATELLNTPSTLSSFEFEGVFPDTLDEEEENGDKLFKGIFPDTLDD